MSKVAVAHYNPKIRPNLAHNDRSNTKAKNIIKALSYKNECTKSAIDVKKNIDELYKQAKMNFYNFCKIKNGIAKSSGKPKGLQNFTLKSHSVKEFIFEIKSDTSMNDVKFLAEQISKLTGFKILQLAIHRDEGHVNENREFITHYHAHAVFFTLDKNGLQLARQQASMNKKTLSQIQTLAAHCLNMPRARVYRELRERPRFINDIKLYKDYKYHENLLKEKEKKLKELEEKLKEERANLTRHQEIFLKTMQEFQELQELQIQKRKKQK